MKTIQELREDRGETRMQLAEAIGVNLDELTDYELGEAEPSVSRFRALAEHFGVTESEIELRPKSASQ